MFNDRKHLERRVKLRREQTEAERLMWEKLRGSRLGGFKFWRQYGVGPYVLDFYCPARRLAVELDGAQHGEAEGRTHDANRTYVLGQLRIRVLRFWNNDAMARQAATLNAILTALKSGK